MPEPHSYNLRDRSTIKRSLSIKDEVHQHMYNLRQQKKIDYKPFLASDDVDDVDDVDDTSYFRTFKKVS
tara:strand:+ start:451 stop:657 length:207 start_codon:yes stop_codon:yes gene_type:complete